LFWQGRPITEVAIDLGINAGTREHWVAAWHEDNPEPAKANYKFDWN
jgi:transposase-like protein